MAEYQEDGVFVGSCVVFRYNKNEEGLVTISPTTSNICHRWTVHKNKTAVGHFAMLILYNGTISNDGNYYALDEHLPDVHYNKDGALRAYKRLCAKGIDDNDLTDSFWEIWGD